MTGNYLAVPTLIFFMLQAQAAVATSDSENIDPKTDQKYLTFQQLSEAGALVWDSESDQWVLDLQTLNLKLRKKSKPTVFDSHDTFDNTVRTSSRSSNW